MPLTPEQEMEATQLARMHGGARGGDSPMMMDMIREALGRQHGGARQDPTTQMGAAGMAGTPMSPDLLSILLARQHMGARGGGSPQVVPPTMPAMDLNQYVNSFGK